MLARAAGWVKPGGTLVYAVCSLERIEGERVAEGFAVGHGFALDPVAAGELPAGMDVDDAGRVRIVPGTLAEQGGADGFFVARFRRVA
jgi:16S rRNA (cytosine967-C5)-methyltransferase